MIKEKQDLQEQQVEQEKLELLVDLDLQVIQDPQEHRVRLDKREELESLDLLE